MADEKPKPNANVYARSDAGSGAKASASARVNAGSKAGASASAKAGSKADVNAGASAGECRAKAAARAAALSYGPEEDVAPKVTAAGKGYVASRIVEAAREAGVPVYDDPALAETLSRLKIGEEIPPELYEVVASILAYIVAVDTRHGGLYTSIKNAKM